MSPRTGRPTENPKNVRIGVRLTQDEKEMLDECEKKLNLTKTEIISLGIQKLPFYHFDVYRIGDVEEMDEVGFDEYVSGEGVSLIEWANLIEEILPENRVNITIEKDLEQGFDFRRITIEERRKSNV